jgi:hypothetical protein
MVTTTVLSLKRSTLIPWCPRVYDFKEPAVEEKPRMSMMHRTHFSNNATLLGHVLSVNKCQLFT